MIMVIAAPNPQYVGPAKWHGADNNEPINRVVIHATVGSEPYMVGAAEATVRYSKTTTRPSSYHYISDSRHSLQYVWDKTVAYGAPPNQHSIHYEICCSLSNQGRGHWVKVDHQQAMLITAKDVARLCLHYHLPIVKLGYLALRAGKRGITGHNDVTLAWHQTDHTDPGPYFPWKQFIALVRAEADALLEPTDPTRGAVIDKAIADLELAAKKAAAQSPRRRKIMAALTSLRTIKPK